MNEGAEFAGRWDSRWVWLGDTGLRAAGIGATVSDDVVDRFLLLRREFELDSRPQAATLRLAANSRMVAWINGIPVARGPVRADPRRMRSEVAEVAAALVPGRNVVAILARYYGCATAWWLPAPPTLGLGGAAVTAELSVDGGVVVGTDRSWRAVEGAAWAGQPRPEAMAGFFAEELDARLLPVGWERAGFDDSAWRHAEELSPRTFGDRGRSTPPADPFGPLPPRPIPQLDGRRRAPASGFLVPIASPAEPDAASQIRSDQELADPAAARPLADPESVELPAGSDWLVVHDFGETVAGTFCLEIEAPAGTRVDVSLGEERDDDGLLAPGHVHASLRYTARGGEDRFEGFDPVGGRFAALAVRSAGPVRLRAAIQERLFPRTPESTGFRCSDADLERIFEVGLRTVDLCSQDAYLDCPTREARAWAGDAVVHQSVHLATADDWSLARWNPRLAANPRSDGMLPMTAVADFGGGPMDAVYIPDWALHWIRSVHNLMRYGGDRELVRSLLPTAEGVLRWFLPYRGGDGLLADVPGWVLIDWSNVPVDGTSAALNALWARGLRDFEQMATWLGDAGRAEWAAGLREGVRASFECFWDPGRDLYRDNRVDGAVGPTVSRHTAAAAVCAGIVPRSRLAAVGRALARRDRLAHSAPVLEAFAAGDMERGLGMVIDGVPAPDWDLANEVLEAQPFFRYVVHEALAECGCAHLVADACRDWRAFLERGERTWPEGWAGGSHCHGWSSTPTRDLIAYTLGITPAEPGFGRVRVSPAPGDLEWIEGTAPTPSGRVWVRAEPGRLEVESPVPILIGSGEEMPLPPGRHTLDVIFDPFVSVRERN